MHNHHGNEHYMRMIWKNKELREMYIAMSMKRLALSMIGIFIPLFLIKELSMTLYQVIIFYAIHTMAYMIFCPFAGKIASKFGLKKAAIASIPLYIFVYLCLHNIHAWSVNINQLAALFGITECLFFIPFTVHFVKSSDKKHRSEEVGFLFSSSILASVLGPLIGGLLLTFYSFDILFMIVVIFLFLSIFPMIFTKEYHVISKFRFRNIFEVSKEASYKWIAYGSHVISEWVFWPIFLFSVLGVYAKMGFVFTLAALASAISAFYFGIKSRKKDYKKIIRPGGVLHSLSWVCRGLFNGSMILSFFTVLGAFANMMILVPFSAMQFDRVSRKKYLVEYFVYRSLMITIGKCIVLVIIAVFLNYKLSFLVTGALGLLHLI